MTSAVMRRRPRRLGSAIATVGTGVSLVVLVPLAMVSDVGRILALGAAAFLVALTALGLERTAVFLGVAGYLFAPMTSLVLPGASFVTFSDLCLVLAFGLVAPVLAYRQLTLPTMFVMGSLLLVVVGVATSALSESPAESFGILVRIIAATLILPVMIAWWRPSVDVVTAFAAANLAGVTISLLVGQAQGFSVSVGRSLGLSEQPTAFGFAAMLAVCLVPYLYVKSTGFRRWLVVVGALAGLYSIWISGSRTALAVLALLVAMYPVMERSLKAAGVLALGGVILIANVDRVFDQQGSNALARLLGGAGTQGSNQERIENLGEALDRFAQHPVIGAGWNFDVLLAHNIYAQFLSAMGVLGTLGFLMITWVMISPLFRGPSPERLLAYPALAYALAGPIVPNVGSRYVTVLLALGLLVACQTRRDSTDEADDDETAHGDGAVTARPGEASAP